MEKENGLGLLGGKEGDKKRYRERIQRLQARVDAHKALERNQYSELFVSIAYLRPNEIDILEGFVVRCLNAQRQSAENWLSSM